MKQAIQLALLSSANVGLAFLSQWYIFIQIGPGFEADAFFAGMVIPQVVLAVVIGSLKHVLVPLFAGENEDQLRQHIWGLLIIVGSFFALLAIALYMAAAWWVPFTVPGFTQPALILTIKLAQIQLIGMVITAIHGVQWAAYQARQQFIWVEFSAILANVLTLSVLIWALPHYGIEAAAWIIVLRFLLQILLLAPGLGGFVFPDLQSNAIMQTWQRIKLMLLGATYINTDSVVDRFLLSCTTSGSLSLYYLAQQIYAALSLVLNKAIATPLVPLLSTLHKVDDIEGFRQLYRQKLLQVSVITISCLIMFGLLGRLLLGSAMGYGSFSADNVNSLLWYMLWLSGMFVGNTAGQICTYSFYAQGNTATPTRLSIITYTTYIPTKVIAFYLWGIAGLAISTSLYHIVNLVLYAYLCEKKQTV